MDTEKIIQKIKSYLSNSLFQPLIVDVSTTEEIKILKSEFDNDSTIDLLDISDFCNGDQSPQIEMVFNKITKFDKPVILFGFSTALKLFGIDFIKKGLNIALGLNLNEKVIIVSYQCDNYLHFIDPKIYARISISKNSEIKRSRIPYIIFTSDSIEIPNKEIVANNLGEMFSLIEENDGGYIYVKTNKQKSDYVNSLIDIRDMKNAYRFICHNFPIVEKVNDSFGSEEQWEYLYEKSNGFSSLEELFNNEFGHYDCLDQYIMNWKTFNSNKKWLYFLGMKLFPIKLWCIKASLQSAESVNEFVRAIYRCLDNVDFKSKSFWKKYDERKKIINAIGPSSDEALNYTKFIGSKGRNAIYYLTDATEIEREAIINSIVANGYAISRIDLINILSHVYPALSKYFREFDFKNDFLNSYFQDYKYQKVINKISEDFKKRVEEQAVIRKYNEWLQPRSSILHKLNKNNSELYFFDALGVEYLGYIHSLCEEKGLHAKATVFRCNLPSITSENKEFIEEFSAANVKINDIKDLDEIKHKGKLDYYYDKNKNPIYITRELEIINEQIEKIKSSLNDNHFERAFIISDHGATRLAVINENTLKIDAYSKGKHGGRICEITEDVRPETIPQATQEGNLLILANYDMFQGGKRPTVEVHGGATLEEICVPVIEITIDNGETKFEFKVIDKEIKASPITNPILKFYSFDKIYNVTVVLNDQTYSAKSNDGQNFEVELPKLSSGKYSFNIFYDNELVGENYQFEIINGMKNNDFGSMFNF